MYNSETEMENGTADSFGEDGENDVWADLAVKFGDREGQSPSAGADLAAKLGDRKGQSPSTGADSSQLPVFSVIADIVSSMSPTRSLGRPGSKGDASQLPLPNGQLLDPTVPLDYLQRSPELHKQSPGVRSTDRGPAVLTDFEKIPARLRGTLDVERFEMVEHMAVPKPAEAPPTGAPIKDSKPKPAHSEVDELLDFLVPGAAIAKRLAPGAGAAAKAGEAAVKKNVIPKAEKAVDDVLKSADDAAKALEDAAQKTTNELVKKADEARRALDDAAKTVEDAGKKAANDLVKKADEARRAFDDGAKKAGDEAAKAFGALFGKPRK